MYGYQIVTLYTLNLHMLDVSSISVKLESIIYISINKPNKLHLKLLYYLPALHARDVW